MKRWTRSAPCKINLALDILGRREDGYHDMYMVMQTVSLCDRVSVEETGGGFLLDLEGLTLPDGVKSLEERAAEAFFCRIGKAQPPLRVKLEKVTPAYAGLGGGSADVAALLWILREAYAPELPAEELEAIGFQVGSDMPFCVRGGTALAEGRGEILTDLAPLPECYILLCKPEFGISTPTLFARFHSVGVGERPDVAGMAKALKEGDLAGVAARVGNIFEQLLPEECGEVFVIKKLMMEYGALNAAMSGSGPTVFGIFADEEAARNAERALKQDYPETFLTRPVKKF